MFTSIDGEQFGTSGLILKSTTVDAQWTQLWCL